MHNKFSFGICFVSFNCFTGVLSAHICLVKFVNFSAQQNKRTSERAQRETNPSIIANRNGVFRRFGI